jgi:uncharacterized protein (DUF1015 family)
MVEGIKKHKETIWGIPMFVQRITDSYLNLSGNIYDSDFINLAQIEQERIRFDQRTQFLTEEQKEMLNTHPIKGFENAIYVFELNGKYGIVCDVPIEHYKLDRIQRHELVLPDTIQGMTSNLRGYNAEAAPVIMYN